ncbi:VCBS repeat-containing protein [Ruficoccus amylovorans]|uniref:VCBS repeat-containing protein n=1 Tax=Ruficoccus amylovorans TaxID=1804625 RepID=A0A842HGW9_9BACT|nr:VCBS repeat-containing protein [Ruficoccus amylovorans]MBC2595238.1 VCBS repeat-containing protein [Ruficoccus amylovorans]
MNTSIRTLSFAFLLSACLPATAGSLPGDDTQPLKSAAPSGLGMLNLHNTNSSPVGAVYLSTANRPDLFMSGTGGPKNLSYFKYAGEQDDGTPIFSAPQLITTPATQKGTIFQTPDGEVHAYWILDKEILHTVFNENRLSFDEQDRLPLSKLKLPKGPQSLSVIPNDDDTVDILFDLADDTPPGDSSKRWTEEWRPYDDKGSWTGQRPYRYFHAVRLSSVDLDRADVLDSQQATPSQREVYFRIGGSSPVDVQPELSRDFVSASRLGNLYYYPSANTGDYDAPIRFKEKLLIAGEDGNALRDTATSGRALTYPNEQGAWADIMVSGEGTLNYYAFTGRFTPAGAPIYKAPTKVLQKNADLVSGALPTPSVIDWDGDGKLDILVGVSEGLIVFHKNTGTNDEPAFTESSYLRLADGRLLHVEAGYSGSVQGLQEAHWGYISPNAFDWNRDGLPDIVTGDITGDYNVYLNKGTPTEPALAPAHPLYCDGIPLHGVWRARPALAHVGDRTILILPDDKDTLHLYTRIDDYNVEDAGILTLEDGSPITVSGMPGGASGRCKLDLADWDGDGVLDLIIGTSRRNAIPNPETGYPFAALGEKAPGTVLFMKNTGTNEQPVFAFPVPFRHKITGELIQPGGAHESGAVATPLGGGLNILAGDESSRLYLYRGENLELAR